MKVKKYNPTKELIDLAQAMLDGKLDLIDGTQTICYLRRVISDPDNEIFLPFQLIESDTDRYPRGTARARCEEKYLKRVDRELAEYLRDAKQDIIDGCKNILETYGKNTDNSE